MIKFFIGGVLHLFANRRVARYCGVPLIQALRSDFASMIDAHQTRCMCFRARV
jgi:hypothetical protein